MAALTLSAAALVGIVLHEGYTDRAVIPVKGDVPTIGFGTTTDVKIGDTTTPPKALAWEPITIPQPFPVGVFLPVAPVLACWRAGVLACLRAGVRACVLAGDAGDAVGTGGCRKRLNAVWRRAGEAIGPRIGLSWIAANKKPRFREV
ncbi:hypothetical protein [Thermomonas sp.]|uniref:hypothetical protein n=1 Tax=Thermomonas sp. TaxID=1971895 RepID=UPI002603F44E|nr:hypothetical protein [Thermomonas sp.]